MIGRLKALFGDVAGGEDNVRQHQADELQLAAAALLVEAGRMDHAFDEAERETITRLLRDRFALSLAETQDLMAAANAEVEDAVELYSFARLVKDRFSHDERIELMGMLWEVVYADGQLHDYEASLLRRIAGLIYVSDRESGSARKRALERLGQNED
ncbi:MAG: TerB family tellurite resistance protein [Alphaproteobacteria bacterium]